MTVTIFYTKALEEFELELRNFELNLFEADEQFKEWIIE